MDPVKVMSIEPVLTRGDDHDTWTDKTGVTMYKFKLTLQTGEEIIASAKSPTYKAAQQGDDITYDIRFPADEATKKLAVVVNVNNGKKKAFGGSTSSAAPAKFKSTSGYVKKDDAYWRNQKISISRKTGSSLAIAFLVKVKEKTGHAPTIEQVYDQIKGFQGFILINHNDPAGEETMNLRMSALARAVECVDLGLASTGKEVFALALEFCKIENVNVS